MAIKWKRSLRAGVDKRLEWILTQSSERVRPDLRALGEGADSQPPQQ